MEVNGFSVTWPFICFFFFFPEILFKCGIQPSCERAFFVLFCFKTEPVNCYLIPSSPKLLLMFPSGSRNSGGVLGTWQLSFSWLLSPCKTLTDSGVVYWGQRSWKEGVEPLQPPAVSGFTGHSSPGIEIFQFRNSSIRRKKNCRRFLISRRTYFRRMLVCARNIYIFNYVYMCMC